MLCAGGMLLAQCTKENVSPTPSGSTDENPKWVAASEDSNTDRYIIKFNENKLSKLLPSGLVQDADRELVKTALNTALASLGLEASQVVHHYTHVYPGVAMPLSATALDRVLASDLVDLVSPDGIVRVDIQENSTPRTQLKSQSTPWGIQRVGTADGSGKTAWVLDTGVDLDHPDLKVDPVRSQSFATGDGTFLSNGGDDNQGHGTHVAGTIAALDNNTGVIGVAAGATVVSVKVLGGNGTGLVTDVIAGVDYVAGLSLPGDVANMSLSGGANSLMDLAVQSASAAGTWYVLAAGNDRRDANLNSPARANGPFLVTVSAFRSGDRWAGFSNFGNPPVDFAGPGQGITSTYRNGGYRTLSGTSMAAPHLAGLYLISNGTPNTDGTVSNDPDGNPDPIAVY